MSKTTMWATRILTIISAIVLIALGWVKGNGIDMGQVSMLVDTIMAILGVGTAAGAVALKVKDVKAKKAAKIE